MLIDALSSSLSGINAASKRLEVSADNIARASVEDSVQKRVFQQALETGGVESKVYTVSAPIDYAKEFSEQTIAMVSSKASARVYQVVQDMMDVVNREIDKPKKQVSFPA
ncbi:MAG: hypothetical protein HQM15_04220 [Deltaproteobacteria bacterium]|nr:hypothetical protein [Deltaproteobacteria bacterium]